MIYVYVGVVESERQSCVSCEIICCRLMTWVLQPLIRTWPISLNQSKARRVSVTFGCKSLFSAARGQSWRHFVERILGVWEATFYIIFHKGQGSDLFAQCKYEVTCLCVFLLYFLCVMKRFGINRTDMEFSLAAATDNGWIWNLKIRFLSLGVELWNNGKSRVGDGARRALYSHLVLFETLCFHSFH